MFFPSSAGDRIRPCPPHPLPNPDPSSPLFPPTTMAGADQGLPPKDAALFRSIVKHYDNKAYKKGVKVADPILK